MEHSTQVGIRGKEGAAAVLNADYSFAKFKFLERLLLVHGRWSHHRNAYLILYTYYKNLALCCLQIFFAFFNGFTGTVRERGTGDG